MSQQGPLQWLDGEGWLVLGGCQAGEATDLVDTRLLSVVNLDRPMLVMLAEGSRRDATRVLEHYTRLGGPGGEAVSLAQMTRTQLQDPGLLETISEAGVLYLGGANPLPLVRTLYGTPALDRILRGFTTLQGLTLIGADAGAAALGTWVAVGLQVTEGLGLVMNTVIVPRFIRTEDTPVLRHIGQLDAQALGLGIPPGTALALGPQGQVETWGTQQVTAVIKATEDEDTP